MKPFELNYNFDMKWDCTMRKIPISSIVYMYADRQYETWRGNRMHSFIYVRVFEQGFIKLGEWRCKEYYTNAIHPKRYEYVD